jgi:hypothetical protein
MLSSRSSVRPVHTQSTHRPAGMSIPRHSRGRNTTSSISLKRYAGTDSLRARYLHDSDALELSVPAHPPHLAVASAAGVEILHPQPQRHTPHKLVQGTYFLPSLSAYTIEHSLDRPSNPIVRDEKFGLVFPAPPPPSRALLQTPTPGPDVPALPSRPVLARPALLRSRFLIPVFNNLVSAVLLFRRATDFRLLVRFTRATDSTTHSPKANWPRARHRSGRFRSYLLTRQAAFARIECCVERDQDDATYRIARIAVRMRVLINKKK